MGRMVNYKMDTEVVKGPYKVRCDRMAARDRKEITLMDAAIGARGASFGNRSRP